MVEASPALICKCKIKERKIIFCPAHRAAEDLLASLECAWRFTADHSLPAAGEEELKNQIVLPYIESVLTRVRRLE
jgi:hypothetical protein